MRSKHKQWRNGPGGKWSTRIIWYQGEEPNDIRLEMVDCERETQVFPKSREEADHIWFQFRQGSPQNGETLPVIKDTLELLSQKYPHLVFNRSIVPEKENKQ